MIHNVIFVESLQDSRATLILIQSGALLALDCWMKPFRDRDWISSRARRRTAEPRYCTGRCSTLSRYRRLKGHYLFKTAKVWLRAPVS